MGGEVAGGCSSSIDLYLTSRKEREICGIRQARVQLHDGWATRPVSKSSQRGGGIERLPEIELFLPFLNHLSFY